MIIYIIGTQCKVLVIHKISKLMQNKIHPENHMISYYAMRVLN